HLTGRNQVLLHLLDQRQGFIHVVLALDLREVNAKIWGLQVSQKNGPELVRRDLLSGLIMQQEIRAPLVASGRGGIPAQLLVFRAVRETDGDLPIGGMAKIDEDLFQI